MFDFFTTRIGKITPTKGGGFLVLFTSDIHGNASQYTKLFSKALDCKTKVVIIGGDIAPKDTKYRTIRGQKTFFENVLFPLIRQFHCNNHYSGHNCRIFLMMGNDDFKSNQIFLDRHQREVGFTTIHNKCVSLNAHFNIVGYSYVPFTPFRYKDWEKPDLITENEFVTRGDVRLDGLKSKGTALRPVTIRLDYRQSSIERDVTRLMEQTNPAVTILVTHAPPYNTYLDMTHNKDHVGSRALRKIIGEKQPYVTLHGHIHETVEMSGKFIDVIGESVCMTSGNSHIPERPYVVEFDLYNPIHARRELLT